MHDHCIPTCNQLQKEHDHFVVHDLVSVLDCCLMQLSAYKNDVFSEGILEKEAMYDHIFIMAAQQTLHVFSIKK